MGRLLIVRPGTDGTEQMLSAWAERVMHTVASSPEDFAHVEIEDLQGPGLTREAVGRFLGDTKTVVYYGHGSEDALGFPVLIGVSDAAGIGDGVVVAFACHAGGVLASDATASGLRCFVGFTDAFLVAPDSTNAPWSVWMETAITSALMTHGTAAEVMSALADRFGWIFKTFKEGQYATLANAPVLWLTADWNLRHLALAGDGSCPLI